MIIRTIKGIVLSLLLHILIFFIFFINFKDIQTKFPSKKSKKISLNLANFTTPKKPQIRPKIKQPSNKHNTKPIKPKLKKSKQKRKIEKQKQKQKVIKKRTSKKELLRKKSNDILVNKLMNSLKPKYTKKRTPSTKGSYGTRMINKLYGREFNSFTSTQKKFIKNNLSTIHIITQRTLTRNGYPEIAARTQQQGTNIVSFYLHPNGDISKLRLKTPIGYRALDNNTLEVIRIAYKNYPLPNQKTKIIFYVQYSIY